MQQRQQQQQQDSSEAAGLNVQSVQHVQTSGGALEAGHTTGQPLHTSVQPSAGVIAVEDAEVPSFVQPGADLEECDSRAMSADSKERLSSTSVEVRILPD